MESEVPKVVLLVTAAISNLMLLFLFKYSVELVMTNSDDTTTTEKVKSDIFVTTMFLVVYFVLWALFMIFVTAFVLGTPQGRGVSQIYSLVHD